MSKLAPVRSSLLTKHIRGTLYFSAWRHTVSDCGSTPATPSKQATAPSSTRKLTLDLDGEVDVARRVDDVDPVLGALALRPLQKQVVAADVIVIPRSCSCSIQSIVAVPSWTSPIL